MKNHVSRPRQLAAITAMAALGGGAALFSGCAAYSSVVKHRCRSWEARQSWNADGERAGCQAREAGHGSPALLLVHGFADNPTVWLPMMDDLTARGYHCRAMRLPGFGDKLDAREKVTGASWDNAVDAELRRLRQHHPEIWLVGHSLGGAISIRHLLDHNPQGVRGIILIAPLLEVSRARSPIFSARTWHQCFGTFVSITETPFPEDIRKPPPASRTEVDLFITPNINDALFALLEDIHPRAPEIRLPLFLAISPHDKVVSPDAAKAWFDRASGAPSRRLFIARESGHVIPLDYDAVTLAADMDAFIRETEGRTK